VAGGYEKLVLYGTSYGTKVAEEYAQAYPSHVEALVLDSVVPPNGPEPLNRATFAAIPRILRQLCAAARLRTHHPQPRRRPRAARQAAGTRGPLSGRAIDGHGKAHTVRISSDELLGILLAGRSRTDPAQPNSPPRSARPRRRHAALARLDLSALGSGEGEAEARARASTRRCTTRRPAKSRSSRGAARPPRPRIAEAGAADRALPRARSRRSPRPTCSTSATSRPAPSGRSHARAGTVEDAPFPSVPTLILSGADDLRTPTANAREVAAQIPDSQLLVVPNTGHSVLGSDQTHCASDALQALFADPADQALPATPRRRACARRRCRRRVLALVAPASGYSGGPDARCTRSR
jgi:pimeloyl-ACP methyl ester carboxylesterase